MFGPLNYHRCTGNIVILKIVIHFTVTFTGKKNIHRYTGNIVISRIVISGFHCA